MKTGRLLLFSLVIVFFLLINVIPVQADGIVIPQPPPCFLEEECEFPIISKPMMQLEIKYHHVDVEISKQIAITHVDQVFYNPNNYEIEGKYVFPIPKGASITNFQLWIDGVAVKGEMLEKEEAREQYEAIVREMKDPALLEYVDQKAVAVNMYPFPPKGERKIELEYSQTLPLDNGMVEYIYPLSTEKFSLQPLESVVVNVDIQSEPPIRAVYSPTHKISSSRLNENRYQVSYEESGVIPDKDFSIVYSVGESEAFHVLSYRNPEDKDDPDGYFMLLLAPKPKYDSEKVIDKDVFLVIDCSGSMEGEKFSQAQSAAEFVLGHLNENDRFFITTFSDGIDFYASKLQPSDDAGEAIDWIYEQSAAGSTDINRALLETISQVDSERPAYLVFLTDGLPTEGVINSEDILDNVSAVLPSNLRLFSFGVGYDVDTFLLDSLSTNNHGISTYVLPEEEIDEVVSGFYAKISTPVLTDLKIDFNDINVYGLYPNPLPDFFIGSQIVLLGRYKEGGMTDVVLSGDINGEEVQVDFDNQVFDKDSRDDTGTVAEIPRLWATRKIGYLLNKIRLEGPNEETVEQIVRLSTRFGIITPYTSYLVTEEVPLGQQQQEQYSMDVFEELDGMPAAPVYGQAAVEKAAAEGELLRADVAPSTAVETNDQMLVTVGTRTFIRDGKYWVDTQYDPEIMPIEIAFLSEDYFRFIEMRPDAAAGISLGTNVIIVVDGVPYEIVAEDEIVEPVDIPGLSMGEISAPDMDNNSTYEPVLFHSDGTKIIAVDKQFKDKNDDGLMRVQMLILIIIFGIFSLLFCVLFFGYLMRRMKI